MRRSISTAIAILIFLGLASPAYAIDLRPQLNKLIPQRVEKMASRAAEMRATQQAKLKEFRDQRKAKIVEQLTESLNKINQRHTEQMTKNLARMTEILSKVEANSKTPAAQTAIVTAQTAVTAQAGKDYTITVSSESKVQEDAKRTRNQLKTDIEATNKLVMAAKQALIAAIRESKGE